ncbi:MAG: amidohydrolase [candidate division WOR-3 bacterium]
MTERSYIISAKSIYSLDANNNTYQYLMIDNGKITEVSNTPLPYTVNKISYPDKYIIPGFIDSHTHILGTGLQLIFPEVSKAECLEEIYDKILSARSLINEQGFILVYNFDPDRIKEKRFPHRQELDKVIKNYPIILYRIDGHSAVLNSKALEIIFETKSEDIEQGLELDKYREPTGLLTGKAYEFTNRYFANKISPNVRIEAFYQACELALKNGVTTMVTMIGSDQDDLSVRLLMQVIDKLPIEVIPFYQTIDFSQARKFNLPRIGGCILIDGSFGSHTAALKNDYTDQQNNRGILYYQDETLENFYQEAEKYKLQTAVHAIGDRAIEQVVSILEKIIKENSNRHRIEHCELLDDNLINRIKKLDLILSMQPAFEYYWGGPNKMYAQRLGTRWHQTNPFKKLFDQGIIIVGGSDAPITPIDPLLGIKSAVQHPNPDHRISPIQALKMFTTNGAWAIFAEDRIGKIASNYQADFTVLEKDPLQFNDNKIIAVYKAGKKIFG